MFFGFEGFVQFHALHVVVLRFVSHGFGQVYAFFDEFAVRDDVQVPIVEFFDFALFFADYHCYAGLAHPVDLPLQVCSFLFVRCPR